jgi:hypothetical protein
MLCLVCKAPLGLPTGVKAESGLSLKRSSNPNSPPVSLTDVEAPEDEEISLVDVAQAAAGVPIAVDVHAGRAEEGQSRGWISLLAFCAVAALLIGFQYKHEDFSSYATFYFWGRNLLAAAVFLLVVLIAFQDNLGSGAVCLFIPPYSLVYVSSNIESHLLRGVFFGVVAALATEVYLMPDASVAGAIGYAMGNLIDTVDNLILRASM